MRIRTVVGLAIATAATAGGVALGTAAFANEPGTEPVYRIGETSTADTYTPAAGREDCPEKNGQQGGGQSEGPGGQSEAPAAPETAPAETL